MANGRRQSRAQLAVALLACLIAAVAACPSQAAVPAKAPPTPCRLRVPAGQKLLWGVVLLKGTSRTGMFEGFQFLSGRVRYTVVTNFYDGRRPLTRVVNLACKESPVQFIQVGELVRVVGRPGGTKRKPILRATTVQVATYKDRGA